MMDLERPFPDFAPSAVGFRERARAVAELLAGHLEGVADGPVLGAGSPVELEARFGALDASGARGGADLLAELERVVAHAQHVHHPRFVGHQVAAPLPTAALVAFANAVLNNSSAVFEMGPVGVVMERRVVRFMTDAVGWGAGAGGVLTHGGSIGNLTALLAMRQVVGARRAGAPGRDDAGQRDGSGAADPWAAGGANFAVLTSAESHYCIDRSARIMGWGAGGVARVRARADGTLDTADLPRALQAARADGREVLGVAASACNTALGAFDDLEALADFCQAHDLWLHVDAAHGGPFLLSAATRDRLAGIERADSVVWDLHKMMLMPSLITGVLFKDGRHSAAALAQDASYLFAPGEAAAYDLGHSTLECTKPTIGVTAYLTLAVHGAEVFGRYVERCCGLTRAFADLVHAHPRFELAAEPQGNIACFRHTGADAEGPEASDALQARLRAALVASGAFYIVLATVGGRRLLRTTLIHPATTLGDLRELLAQLDALAAT